MDALLATAHRQLPIVAKRAVAANGAADPRGTADTKNALSKRYQNTPSGVSRNCRRQLTEPDFRQFSKVRGNCRSRSSQIWTIEPDPSLKGATGQNYT